MLFIGGLGVVSDERHDDLYVQATMPLHISCLSLFEQELRLDNQGLQRFQKNISSMMGHSLGEQLLGI